MNRKGFTLIELLAVIILIALIAVLIVPNVLDTLNKSKEESYQILVKNIVTAAENYYTECENGDLSNKTKYGSYACQITITKVKSNIKDDNGITSNKVTYKVEASSGNNCPTTEEYKK